MHSQAELDENASREQPRQRRPQEPMSEKEIARRKRRIASAAACGDSPPKNCSLPELVADAQGNASISVPGMPLSKCVSYIVLAAWQVCARFVQCSCCFPLCARPQRLELRVSKPGYQQPSCLHTGCPGLRCFLSAATPCHPASRWQHCAGASDASCMGPYIVPAHQLVCTIRAPAAGSGH